MSLDLTDTFPRWPWPFTPSLTGHPYDRARAEAFVVSAKANGRSFAQAWGALHDMYIECGCPREWIAEQRPKLVELWRDR